MQRTFDYAPLSTAISLSTDAHLCFAKNLRLRSAIYGYLALYGSLDRIWDTL
ncbi:hypothetical protein LEP1GSC068_0886 [Leptospira sp. Fiocruz LV3954]|nr:hypothetical protein LEP1GSC068_0886 [Leptospira sp. Fiocruz LV3954]